VSSDGGPGDGEEEGKRKEMEKRTRFSIAEEKDRENLALPRLFSDTTGDPAIERHEYDFGYPILTYRRSERSKRCIDQIFAWAGDEIRAERRASAFHAVPIYFSAALAGPGQNYTRWSV